MGDMDVADAFDEPPKRSGGPKPKITDPQILKTLMDVKLTEQMTWPELAAFYEEEYGDSIHPNTIKRALLRDAPSLVLHERVSTQVKEAIEGVWDQVDILRLIMYAFNGRFTEWSILYERNLSSYVDESKPMSAEQRNRMDGLWGDLVSFFMRALTIMKELKTTDAPVPEFELLIKARTTIETTGADAHEVTMAAIKDMMSDVDIKTASMLENLHLKHREEGKGFYRQIPDNEDYDLMEVDDGSS